MTISPIDLSANRLEIGDTLPLKTKMDNTIDGLQGKMNEVVNLANTISSLGISGITIVDWNFDASLGAYPSDPNIGDAYIIGTGGTIEDVEYLEGAIIFWSGEDWYFSNAGRPVQSSPTDTTAGALMTVGAFGLGTSSVYAGDLNDINYAGFVFAGLASTNRPPGSSAGHVYTNRHSDADHFSQVFIQYNTTSMWVRTCVAGSWNAWVEIPNLATAQTWTAIQTFTQNPRIRKGVPQFIFTSPDGVTHSYHIGANISDSVNSGFRIGYGPSLVGGAGLADFRQSGIALGNSTDNPDVTAYGDYVAGTAGKGFKLPSGKIYNDTRLQVGGFLNIPFASTTIAGGVITATASGMTLATEGGAASDDLDTINGGSDGDILWLKIANAAQDVVVKDGSGNLRLNGDCTLGDPQDRILLQNRGGIVWDEISRSVNI